MNVGDYALKKGCLIFQARIAFLCMFSTFEIKFYKQN